MSDKDLNEESLPVHTQYLKDALLWSSHDSNGIKVKAMHDLLELLSSMHCADTVNINSK